MKKLFSVLLVFALVLSLAGAVFASERPDKSNNGVRSDRPKLMVTATQDQDELDDEDGEEKPDKAPKLAKRSSIKKIKLQKAPLFTVTEGDSSKLSENTIKGHVMLVHSLGIHDLGIHGVIHDLAPNETFFVWVRDLGDFEGDSLGQYEWLGYFKLATFMTDAEGHGNFHIKILDEDLPAGEYTLQVAINDDGEDNGNTVAATEYNLDVSVD